MKPQFVPGQVMAGSAAAANVVEEKLSHLQLQQENENLKSQVNYLLLVHNWSINEFKNFFFLIVKILDNFIYRYDDISVKFNYHICKMYFMHIL